MVCPRELVLEPTGWCPLECVHCSSDSGPERRDALPERLVYDLIRQASEWGATKVSFGGGEPTALPQLPAFLARVGEMNMSSEVFTCGVLSSAHRLVPLSVDLLGYISGLRQTKLIFSLHGPDAATHEWITRRKGSLAILLDSLSRALALGINCEVNFVPMRPNLASMDAIVGLCRDVGVRRLSILRFVTQGRGLTNREALEPHHVEEAGFLCALAEHRLEGPPTIRTGSPYNHLIPGNQVPCRAGRAKFVVQPDGNVLPCEVFKHAGRRQWALSAQDTPLAEWPRSPQLHAFQESVEAGRFLRCPIHCESNSAWDDHSYVRRVSYA